jgi:hypothetical protein
MDVDGLRSSCCSPAFRGRRNRFGATRRADPEWLLLLLRFAIMHDPGDQAAVLSVANEIDSLGSQPKQSAPSFAEQAVKSARRSSQPTIEIETPFSRSISRASKTIV